MNDKRGDGEKYCDDCKHLHPKEWEQTKEKYGHICALLHKPIKHQDKHPKLPMPSDCPLADLQAQLAKADKRVEELERHLKMNLMMSGFCGFDEIHWTPLAEDIPGKKEQ